MSTENTNTSSTSTKAFKDLSPGMKYKRFGSRGRLFRHTRRERWGYAIMDQKMGDRIAMVFQDGSKRVFRNDYLHLFKPVDRPADVQERIIETLEDLSSKQPARKKRSKKDRVKFDEQLEYFQTLFPEGFQGEAYSEKHRTDGRKTPLKRHRDGLIQKAHALSKENLDEHIREESFSKAFKAAARVLKSSDIVAAKERRLFAGIDAEYHKRIVRALYHLLHGDGDLGPRIDEFQLCLEKVMGCGSWQLATIWLAAVDPENWIPVSRKAVNEQARFMAPGMKVSKRPTGVQYGRVLDMATAIHDRLRTSGLEPRDMLDVFNFMKLTLKPKALRTILDDRA